MKISKRVLENERTRLSSKLVSVIEELTEKFEFLLQMLAKIFERIQLQKENIQVQWLIPSLMILGII